MSHLIPPSANYISTTSLPQTDQLSELIRINGDDLLTAFGVQDTRIRDLMRPLVYWPAKRFAHEVIAFDQRVASESLQQASAWLLDHFSSQHRFVGIEHIPATGPLLLISNHPGLSDALALFTAISRSDLMVIAADRDFLRALPNVSQHLLTVSEGTNERFGLLRRVTRHLRDGGMVLTFPAGKIEPDPALEPQAALDSLDTWSQSLALLARSVEGLQIVPAIVAGVISPRAKNHPLTRLRRSKKDRDWLGATLQILWPPYRDVPLLLQFGPVQLVSDAAQAEQVAAQTIDQARQLIKACSEQ